MWHLVQIQGICKLSILYLYLWIIYPIQLNNRGDEPFLDFFLKVRFLLPSLGEGEVDKVDSIWPA